MFSQFSAISASILVSILGFSLMIPSHSDIPSLIDCFVKIVNGILTRWCMIAHWSFFVRHKSDAALRKISRSSPIDTNFRLSVWDSRCARIVSASSKSCPDLEAKELRQSSCHCKSMPCLLSGHAYQDAWMSTILDRNLEAFRHAYIPAESCIVQWSQRLYLYCNLHQGPEHLYLSTTAPLRLSITSKLTQALVCAWNHGAHL